MKTILATVAALGVLALALPASANPAGCETVPTFFVTASVGSGSPCHPMIVNGVKACR